MVTALYCDIAFYNHIVGHYSLQEGLVGRASSDSKLVSQLSSATSLVRVESAELPQLTEPEAIHKVVKKIKAMYGSCSMEESSDVIHMLGSIQVKDVSVKLT